MAVTSITRLTREIKELARDKGADLVGIAPVSRFQEAPENRHPRFYIPQAQSVVVVAMRVPLGILRSVAKGKEVYTYQGYALKTINAELDMIAFQLANFIERQGYEACPIPANAPRDPLFRWGISHRHAAVAAGMGELGQHQLLLTPELGGKQKLVSIITDAPLEPDPLVKHQICDHCNMCVNICPTQAIAADRLDSFHMDGMELTTGHLTKWRCIFGCGGLVSKGTFAMTEFTLPESRPSTEEMFSYLARKHPAQAYLEREVGAQPAWCAKCYAVCAVHLDKKKGDKSLSSEEKDKYIA